MNQLESIEKEFPLLHKEALKQHANGADYNTVEDSEYIFDLLYFHNTEQGFEFWNCIRFDRYDKARKLQPYLFEEQRWRAEKGGTYYVALKGVVCSRIEQGFGYDDLKYTKGNYYQTEQLALASIAPKEPEKWIPELGQEYYRIDKSTNTPYNAGVRTRPEKTYRSMNCYPTEAAALASLPNATQEQLEQRLEEVNAELAFMQSEKPKIPTGGLQEQPDGTVHYEPTEEEIAHGEMIKRDGPQPDFNNVEFQGKEPPHPHADSWVPAFGMDFSSAQHMSRKWVRM